MQISRRTFVYGLGAGALYQSLPWAAFALTAESVKIFQPMGQSVTIRNGRRFGNRPLYGDHRSFTLLGGDRPLLRLLDTPLPLGSLLIGYVHGGSSAWLHEFDDVRADYHSGWMQWTARDARFPGLTATVSAATVNGRNAAVVKVEATGAPADGRFVLMYGGPIDYASSSLLADADPTLQPSVPYESANFQGNAYIPQLNETYIAFAAESCADTEVSTASGRFSVKRAKNGATIYGVCSRDVAFHVADAAGWRSPANLVASTNAAQPVAVGIVPACAPVLLALDRSAEAPLQAAALQATFEDACARIRAAAQRVVVHTPDAELNAAVPSAAAVINAIYYPPCVVHGAMAWNMPLLGWRSFYGSTCFGWHDRLKTIAMHYLPLQVQKPSYTGVDPDPERRLSLPGPHTRFYGEGRVDADQSFYNMQTVFFDQMIYAWEASGDAEMERILRPALDLHLQWMADCFDPEGEGLYESVLDVWASDSTWYAGGATSFSSAYAYRGHVAAERMAKRAGDAAAEERHRAQAAKIRQALHERMWNPSTGVMAEYIERLGERRRHEDASIDAVMMPIDTNAVDAEMAAQMIDYSERGLQRVPQAPGGETCFGTNFVPHIWSVRENCNADTLHLALACYQAGFAQQGWTLLQGVFRQSLFASVVPGGFLCEPIGYKFCSTDFSDTTNMFTRATLEGLFGLRPDRVDNVFYLAPQYPRGWNDASIETPDISVKFKRKGDMERYTVRLKSPMKLEFCVPVYSTRALSQKLLAQGSVEPGWGHPTFVYRGDAQEHIVEVPYDAAFAGTPSTIFHAEPGSKLQVTQKGVGITAWRDPQGVLAETALVNGHLQLQLRPEITGRHLIVAEVHAGNAHWRQLVKFDIPKPAAVPLTIPVAGAWTMLDIRAFLDADICSIYKQKYLSPRPNSNSAEVGVDGFSWWTATFWRVNPPVITLGKVPSDGVVKATNGVPFQIQRSGANIAFTSFWDNWPSKRSIPIGKAGSLLAVLLCGTTNQMQTGIANGRLTLHYKDGATSSHDIHHPNNFWSVTEPYDYAVDAFALPPVPPPLVPLDEGARAVALMLPLASGKILDRIEWTTLSQEVTIGVMAISLAV